MRKLINYTAAFLEKMKRYNILFISDFFPPHINGGAEISTSLLVRSISKSVNCSVLTQRLEKNKWEFNGIPVHPCLYKTNLSPKGIKDILIYIFGVMFLFPFINFLITRRFIKKHNFDIIQVVSTSHFSFPMILAAISLNKPIVVDIRGGSIDCPTRTSSQLYNKGDFCNKNCFYCMINYPENRRSKIYEFFRPLFVSFYTISFKILRYLLKVNLRKIGYFVSNSNFVGKRLIVDGVPKEKVRTVYNIFNFSNFILNKCLKDESLVFAGRLELNKGIWDAIHAFELIRSKTLKFNIIGDGPEFIRIKKYILEKRLNNIKLMGKLSNHEVLKVYAKSKVILGPSVIPEGFGRFIQEGIATRTPVIATKVGGIPEGIKDHETGLLVEPNNPSQLAKAIKELLTDKTLYYKIVKNLVREEYKYSSENISKQRINIYKEVLREHNKKLKQKKK